MKKFLSLTLALTLTAALAAPVLAEEALGSGLPEGAVPYGRPEMEDTFALPVPDAFVGALTVDGVAVDTSAIPGAPVGYIPMRAFCEAAGAYVEWFPEENRSLFVVDGHSLMVDLATLTLTCDFEPVADVTAYLAPSGYTYLPLSYLTTFENVKDVTNPALSSIHYDLVTLPERTELEALADALVEAADGGMLMELDAQIMEENYFFHMDIYDELVAFQPMISAQPTSIVLARVKDGQMDAAKADFAAYHEAIKATLGFYPATAEAVANAKTVESPDGQCLLFVSTWESNEACIELFNAAYPKIAR